MLQACELDYWTQFLEFVKVRCGATAYENWLAPIQLKAIDEECVTLQVPNVFVKEYLLEHYREDLCSFLPVRPNGEPAIDFIVGEPEQAPALNPVAPKILEPSVSQDLKLNTFYTFENFIEGASNQFVKSAAVGVAMRPGRSYNPFFIHGGVGLGKTHLLHAIGHFAKEQHRKLKIQCITTEAFINDLVDHLRNKSVDKMKRYYRSLDLLLVDDIQFLQNRLNFEEEFCNTFEALINQGKQIVITSDQSPGRLKLSERMIARMEWGLVAQVGMPDLETRVAILQHKAEIKGMQLSQNVAFFIAEHICTNVRQLEGAINRLSAHSRLLNMDITEELVEKTLKEMFYHAPRKKVSVEQILKAVATVFQVRIVDLKGTARNKEVALPRQVAMYLAKEMVEGSLMMLGALFGKTHSTILHACKNIEKRMLKEESLMRQIELVRKRVDEE